MRQPRELGQESLATPRRVQEGRGSYPELREARWRRTSNARDLNSSDEELVKVAKQKNQDRSWPWASG